jgi:hypothetical protein
VTIGWQRHSPVIPDATNATAIRTDDHGYNNLTAAEKSSLDGGHRAAD